MLCEIEWIDANGKSTADTNRAIYRVRTKDRVQQIGGRGVRFEASQWFGCCAEHFKCLAEPGMDIWVCETLLPSYPIDDKYPERAVYTRHARDHRKNGE